MMRPTITSCHTVCAAFTLYQYAILSSEKGSYRQKSGCLPLRASSSFFGCKFCTAGGPLVITGGPCASSLMLMAFDGRECHQSSYTYKDVEPKEIKRRCSGPKAVLRCCTGARYFNRVEGAATHMCVPKHCLCSSLIQKYRRDPAVHQGCSESMRSLQQTGL